MPHPFQTVPTPQNRPTCSQPLGIHRPTSRIASRLITYPPTLPIARPALPSAKNSPLPPVFATAPAKAHLMRYAWQSRANNLDHRGWGNPRLSPCRVISPHRMRAKSPLHPKRPLPRFGIANAFLKSVHPSSVRSVPLHPSANAAFARSAFDRLRSSPVPRCGCAPAAPCAA
jgi:hypothetical protein